MYIETSKLTITCERNEIWTLACAMGDKVMERAKSYIEHRGTYLEGFWKDKPTMCEVDIVQRLYYGIGEVAAFQSLEYSGCIDLSI